MCRSGNQVTAHDIKLELDVRAQGKIERRLEGGWCRERRFWGRRGRLRSRGGVSVGGGSDRWDGEFCVWDSACVCVDCAAGAGGSGGAGRLGQGSIYGDGYETLMGVVYDPFSEEIWTAIRGGPTRLNGKIVRVSGRTELA